MNNILVAASVNIEMAVKDGELFHNPSPLKRILRPEEFSFSIAGSSCNVARTIKRAGIESVKLIATIGDDAIGRLIANELAMEEIDVFPLHWRDSSNVSVNVVVNDHNGNGVFTRSHNRKGSYLPDRLGHEHARITTEVRKTNPRFRVGTGVQLMDVSIIDTLFGSVTDDDGKLICSTNVLNPGVSLLSPDSTSSEAESHRQRELKKLLQKTNLLVLNQFEEAELYQSLGISSIIELRHWSGNQELEMIVTRDQHGAIYRNHGDAEDCSIPACYVPDVVDATGAGDCFLGNFIAQRVRGADVPSAMQFAAAAAALSVRRLGASNPPTLEETQTFLNSYIGTTCPTPRV